MLIEIRENILIAVFLMLLATSWQFTKSAIKELLNPDGEDRALCVVFAIAGYLFSAGCLKFLAGLLA